MKRINNAAISDTAILYDGNIFVYFITIKNFQI